MSDVFIESETPAISLHKSDALVNRLKHGNVYLTKSDKNRKDNRLLNESLVDYMDETEEILGIDSWFDDEIQSNMIIIFISCIIALIAFVFLILLCFNHDKLRKVMSIYMASPNNGAALSDNPTKP